ncbi:MAG: nucleolar RNA-binding Nop10p family protein [Candidatus Woesearchaeota archaeon]|jgi:H/ACA ribonucleoprotein complex subunit 3|nr:nucleolar RNA-binding Nop10p family protein [Candidatus Woesearchaeota archaeon]MDP7476199.1 nucleolar RNA-binding Nop10p family protein [Candidatus Woesearchaeota archaeon]
MRNILKCDKCGKYTMKESCLCEGKALTPKPAKFSVEDKYGAYRRKAKIDFFKKEGLV